MRIIDEIKLDFCDVLIQPKRSETASRSHVSLEKSYRFKSCHGGWSGIPIIASNMSATGTMAMAKELAAQGMMTCLHKFYPDDILLDFFQSSEQIQDNVFYTMGIGDEDFDKYKRLFKAAGSVDTFKRICIDVANGYSKHFVDYVKKVRCLTGSATILAGNVATPEMVQELLISGAADIVKVGVGSGSVCTTRITAGVGFPQLSAVIECADAAHGLGGHVCSDGGCTTPGDVAKAFAAGADYVMLGGMLAGCDECEGEWESHAQSWSEKDYSEFSHIPNDLKKKMSFKFFGMSSKEAADKFNGGLKNYRAAEGKCVTVPYRGLAKDVLQQITGGLRSACSYTGADCLKDLPKCTTFIKVNRTHNTVYG